MAEFLLGLDGGSLLWIQTFIRQDWLSPVVKGFTHLGDNGILWIALCLILLLIPKTRRIGLAGAFALCFSLLCTNLILKPLIDRPRPWLLVEGLVNLVNELDPRSFPSGHTSAAFAAALALFHTLPKNRAKWKWAVIVLATLMGLSRLYVGVHYPSDVLAGALVGAFCGWAGSRLLTMLEERRARM
ncbi:MAG: phosphatase PAP2 family protein [Oscillospiraceae bacterium]|nr:phosphatase PAP2 family protein [Oscillospiraceae bacterium]